MIKFGEKWQKNEEIHRKHEKGVKYRDFNFVSAFL